MPRDAREILSEAVARNSAMVLSLPSAGMLRHHKSRFLNEGNEGVWVEAVPGERALIDELIASANPCGISFKTGDQKINFAAKLLRLEMEYRVNAETVLPALLVERPADVKAVQRRNNYRVSVPGDGELRVRIWRIPENVRVKDKPNHTAELAVALRDISIGGVGVTLMPKDDQPPKVLPGERLRIALKNGDEEELLIEGRMRSGRPAGPTEPIQTGVQFQGLQDGMEGRRTLSELTRIIGVLQLAEVRRHRLGIA
jgi:c-di-GMP-binding flagellar brake protein YcgR